MSYQDLFKKVGKRSSDYRHAPGAYDYDGLAHWWAYNYGYKTTGKGRMSADGNTILSYNTVIAVMMDPPKGKTEPLVLISKYNYSSTTATHIGSVLNAVRHMNVIYVDEVEPTVHRDHIRNLEGFRSGMEAMAEAYRKARVDHTRAAYAESFIKKKDNAEVYAKYFKLRRESVYKSIMRMPDPYDKDFEKILGAEIDKRIKKEKADRAREKRELFEKEKEEKKLADIKLERWKNGEDVYVNKRFMDKTYIRLKDGFIETTENASIPAREACVAFKRYSNGKLKKGAHIGVYTFGGVDSSGDAHIGCHSIPYDDIKSLMETVKPGDLEMGKGDKIESFDDIEADIRASSVVPERMLGNQDVSG